MNKTKPQILADRMAALETLALSSGSHEEFNRGMCVMEAVSYVAGEPWSDAPQCACPIITTFLMSWNDALPDADRTRLLRPLIPLIVGTRSTSEVEERRSYMALDWLIRVFAPKWLDMVPALHEHAKALRDLGAITDIASAEAAGVKLRAARSAAYLAAGSAAGSAAYSAADSAARSAAYSAALSAARSEAYSAADSAARSAAGSAAYSAAYSAALSAAGSAADSATYSAAGSADRSAADSAYLAARSDACSALKPTTEWLQASALTLLHQMIEQTP